MSKKIFENKTHIEGYLYQHSLESKVTGPNSKAPGTKYISGNVEIATDEECTNIVSVHYSYVTPTTSTGKTNVSYGILSDIVDGKYKTVMSHSKEEAAKLRIDSAIGLNEFYVDENNDWRLVSTKRNEGGFIHVTNTLLPDESKRSTFKVDILITGTTRQEANEEQGIPERVIVRGAIFDFKKSLLPVEFTALNEGAMNYYEGLGASNREPVFTNLWGIQQATTIVRNIKEQSAFGEDYVREIRSNRKDFVITGGAAEPYTWDDETTITAAELSNFMAERETYLATVKQRAIEYKSQRNQAPAAPKTTNTVNTGEYNF